jgi:hypothetical protein
MTRERENEKKKKKKRNKGWNSYRNREEAEQQVCEPLGVENEEAIRATTVMGDDEQALVELLMHLFDLMRFLNAN